MLSAHITPQCLNQSQACRESSMAGNHLTGHDHHLIEIAPDTKNDLPATATDDTAPQNYGETKPKWLRKLTSASTNTAVLNDLISRTPMLWYLGPRAGTILRPRTCGARVDALHAVRAVAIGPYHRRDAGLAFPDEAKLPFLRYLQNTCGLDVDRYVAALAAAGGRLRDEFADDEVTTEELWDEERFLKMLLLDSCFILVVSVMLSRSITSGDGTATSAASISREYFILHMAVAQHAEDIKLDMLVLENQIPFAAIKLLFASCHGLRSRLGCGDRPVEELVLGCFDEIWPKRTRGAGDFTGDLTEFYHVLHLFHWSRVPDGKYRILSTPLKLVRIKKESERPFPCANELRESTVWFRKAASGCGSFDVGFWCNKASPVAVMSIPCLKVHECSGVVLHSLVAFEKHFYWAHGACVTAYVACMEGLLKCDQDAVLLRRRGVLASARRTDREVVALFRELGAETAGTRIPDEYAELLDAVAQHRSRRVSRWCGGFVLYFFPTPWVTFSLAAAAALIFVPAMLQTVYTMLSYKCSSGS